MGTRSQLRASREASEGDAARTIIDAVIQGASVLVECQLDHSGRPHELRSRHVLPAATRIRGRDAHRQSFLHHHPSSVGIVDDAKQITTGFCGATTHMHFPPSWQSHLPRGDTSKREQVGNGNQAI
jgi:hypothetical protein